MSATATGGGKINWITILLTAVISAILMVAVSMAMSQVTYNIDPATGKSTGAPVSVTKNRFGIPKAKK